MEKKLRKLPVLVVSPNVDTSCYMVNKLFKNVVRKSTRTFETEEYMIKAFGSGATALSNMRGYKPYYILIDDSFPISIINDFLPLVEGDMTKIKFFTSRGDKIYGN